MAKEKPSYYSDLPVKKCSLPLFEKKSHASTINITTGLIYAPRVVCPIYNATKSALHAFTQVLRQQLNNSGIKIIEVMMPVVDTPWHKGDVPKIAISANKAVREMIQKLQSDKKEIRIGAVPLLYWLSRIAPAFAFRKINQVK